MAGRPTMAESALGLAQQEHEAYAQLSLAMLDDPDVTLRPVAGCQNLQVYVQGHRIGTLARSPDDDGWIPLGSLCLGRDTARDVYADRYVAAEVLVERWRELTWRMYGAMRDLDEEYLSCERFARLPSRPAR